ncbi:hypothetical protein [Nocardia arizonensis]|uniref:hypothetical protein n=1 Tax=Nocardia arizonensis TaxID=1141647 RepID=UPI0006D29D38|nr:hypothetical protein [Nocardia arizonensis]
MRSRCRGFLGSWAAATVVLAAVSSTRVRGTPRRPQRGRVVEIREEIRERVVERSRPPSTDGAVDRVLSDPLAIEKTLRGLARRMRSDPPITDGQLWRHQQYQPLLFDLWVAHSDALGAQAPPVPETPPPTKAPPPGRGAEHRQAVTTVLGSPRSTREVLHELARRARHGGLATSEHAATVAAAQELIDALIVSRTLRLR